MNFRFFKYKLVLCVILFGINVSPVFAGSYIHNQLEDIYSFYQETTEHKTVENLVELDSKLRSFMAHLPVDENGYRMGKDWENWEEKYSRLGLYLEHYNGLFVYNGEFLLNAHKINPYSELRSYTLFSQIDYAEGLGIMPNIKAAQQYLKEFPNGPFAPEVLLTIADFNKDLYMVLRDKDKDYKYDCYEQYIEDKVNYDKQKEDVKNLALAYYGRYLQLKPNDVWANKFEKELRDDSVTGWSFCSD